MEDVPSVSQTTWLEELLVALTDDISRLAYDAAAVHAALCVALIVASHRYHIIACVL